MAINTKDEIKRFIFVADFVSNYYEDDDYIPRSRIVDILFSFEDIFNGGIEHMYNFIRWMQKNDRKDREIMVSINHDINGRFDKCFTPRTWEYQEIK